MVSDAKFFVASQICGSLSSSILGIRFICEISGRSSEKFGIALANARLERRKIGSSIVVARWDRCCAKIDRLELYCMWFPEYAAYIYGAAYLLKLPLNCLLFYAILSIIIHSSQFLVDNMIGVLCCDWVVLKERVLSMFKWIDCLSIRWYSVL